MSKAKILADIKKAEKLGLKVQPGSFGSPITMVCCPMTAVALATTSPDDLTQRERFRETLVMPAVRKRLKVEDDWIIGFIRGYDSLKSDARSTKKEYKAGYELGREIRKEHYK